MKNFQKIFELENNYAEKNDIILSFYQDYLTQLENDKMERSVQSSYEYYLSFTDDMQNRIEESKDIVRTMSLLIERDQFLEHVIVTNGLNQ